MPAGSGSRPSSASSGAVEAECQHEAEADDFDGYADEDGIDDIDDIDDIFSNHGGLREAGLAPQAGLQEVMR